jgi:predicted metal-dependent hydrolase
MTETAASAQERRPIVPREKLNFQLDSGIPKYWFGGDPFKSRYFDAMSTIFPEGERFFMSCVRDFRDRVQDPHLLQEIKHFIRQEGQHGMVHGQFNDHLAAQGIKVEGVERFVKWMLFDVLRKHLPKAHTLAQTAAAEHLTAILAHSLFERREVFDSADPRMLAMWAWHAMEEVEHKAVAFDVMQQAAGVGYVRRVFALLELSWSFPLFTLIVTHNMLRRDGFTRWQRTKLMARGLWWLYKPGGVFTSRSVLGHYFQYFKPGFHPWQAGQMKSYQLWLDTLSETRDPILAGRVLHQAAAL